jgi:DNA-binding transcriptional LysR family regulator
LLESQLTAFVEIARQGAVSRAAETLFVSQPALTARIQRLEADVGSPLFVRTARGMRLTEAGHAFLPHAVRALDVIAEGRRQVEQIDRRGAGRLAVGAAPAISTYVLPDLLKRFADAHPNVSVSVRTGHSEEVLELVLGQQVELGLTRALRHPEIATTPIFEERLVLVVEPQHRLARRRAIGIEEISAEQLILFDRTSSFHQLTSAWFRGAGVSPAGVMELDNSDAAKKMVQQGFGVALLPQSAVHDELASGALREVRIADAEPVRREIVAIRRRDADPPAAPVAAFLETLARYKRSDGRRRKR